MVHLQSKEILLNLSMKCSDSAFNAKGSRLTIVVVEVAVVKILWRHSGKKERQDETQFITKIGGRISFGSQLFSFVKFSFSVTCLMPYYAETGRSRPLIT
jgi:hypothetical protein